MAERASEPVTYPAAPWQMVGSLWLSLFKLKHDVDELRPAGIYGAAFVSYEEGSPLTYLELLCARLLDARRRQVRITDIWVDSPTSMEGGRSLWAIPKDLAKLDLDDRRLGPTSFTEVAGDVDGRRIATGQFAGLPGASLVRAPFAAATSQVREDTGQEVVTSMTGSARTLPALATWDFDPDGPLGFLHGLRPLASFRLTDLRLTFG